MKFVGRKTVILVTHHVSFLMNCEQVLIMESGKVVHQGSPSQMQRLLEEMMRKEEQEEEDLMVEEYSMETEMVELESLSSYAGSDKISRQPEHPHHDHHHHHHRNKHEREQIKKKR